MQNVERKTENPYSLILLTPGSQHPCHPGVTYAVTRVSEGLRPGCQKQLHSAFSKMPRHLIEDTQLTCWKKDKCNR